MGKSVRCESQPQNASFHVNRVWVGILNGIDRSVNFLFWESHLPKTGSSSCCCPCCPRLRDKQKPFPKVCQSSTFVRHWIRLKEKKSAKRIHCQTKNDFNFLKENLAYQLFWIIISAMCSFGLPTAMIERNTMFYTLFQSVVNIGLQSITSKKWLLNLHINTIESGKVKLLFQ